MSAPRLAAAAAALALLAGCATTGAPSAAPAPPPNPADPFERFNRVVYVFNDAFDRDLLKPVATTWREVVPELVRTGVSNFFGNLSDVWSAANHLLQGKPESGLNMGMRVATNTLFGLGGVLDPATEFGLERQSEDFGQTLGRWGLGPGPYLMLPFLGPSSLRDAVALPLDFAGTPPRWHDDGTRFSTLGLRIVNTRAELLGATRLLDDIALDRYGFLRDGYLQRRRNLVYDGEPPEPPPDDGANGGARTEPAPRR